MASAVQGKSELITPSIAKAMIDRSKFKNRPLSGSVVDRLAGLMSGGLWKLNGEAIIFDGDHNILDGQHRLHAVVKSGVSIESVVVRGVPDAQAAFATIGRGKPRSNGDLFSLMGEDNGNALAAAIGVLWRYETIGLSTVTVARSPAGAVAEKWLLDNPDMRHAVARSISLGKGRRSLLPGRFLSFLYCVLSRQSKDHGDKFMSALCAGEGLEAGSPILALRDALIRSKLARREISEREVVNMVFNAWNHWCAGKTKRHAKILSRENAAKDLPALATPLEECA